MNFRNEPQVSVVVPMHNEQDGVLDTLRRLRKQLDKSQASWEVIVVDDGSTDETKRFAHEASRHDDRIRVLSHTPRAGRGYALRKGFAAARGEFITTIDADLSYSPDHIVRMVEALEADPRLDIVLASAYMPGGSVTGVPRKRLWISRLGNAVLRRAYGKQWHTLTCIVRGYRREALERLPLDSDGKEIHLEILSKARACGMKVAEIPGHLRARQKGRSKFRCGRTSATHLSWALAERPGLALGPLSGLVAVLLVASVFTGGVAGAIASGAALGIACGLGLIANQLAELRRERLRAESRLHVRDSAPDHPRLAQLPFKSA